MPAHRFQRSAEERSMENDFPKRAVLGSLSSKLPSDDNGKRANLPGKRLTSVPNVFVSSGNSDGDLQMLDEPQPELAPTRGFGPLH